MKKKQTSKWNEDWPVYEYNIEVLKVEVDVDGTGSWSWRVILMAMVLDGEGWSSWQWFLIVKGDLGMMVKSAWKMKGREIRINVA